MRIGYIGSSAISNFHLEALKKNGFNITAIGTTKNSKRCLEFSNSNNLQNYFCNEGWEGVLSKELDAYFICVKVTPTLDILKAALKKNKPIFVEKPIGWKPSELYQILNHKNINNVFVGFNRRFYQVTNILKKICEESSGGTILVNIPESDYGIKQFISNGCHMINTLMYLIGDFKLCEKRIKFNSKLEDIDSVSAICKNEKWDILLNYHSQIPSNFSITINADKKVYELKPIEKLSIYEGMDVIEPTKEEPIRKYLPHLSNVFIEDNKLKPGFYEMHKNFKLFANNEESQSCSFLEAYKTISFIWELIDSEIAKNIEFN